MTIRHRITLVVLLMFVALATIGGYATYQARRSAAQVRQVTQGVVPSALASSDLVAEVKDVQLATMTLVYAPDANMVAQAQAQLKTKQAQLRQALDLQAQAAASHAQRGLVAQARESMANYFSAIEETERMKASGQEALAQAFLFADVGEYRNELEGIVETMRIEKNRQKDDAIGSLNGMLATTTTAIGGATAAAIALLTLIGMLLYRQITRPLTRMQAEMSEIAEKQDFTRRVPVARMDEIGRSIVAFNDMIEKIEESALQLKQKTADIQAMLQNMQQGILTVVDGGLVHGEYSAYLEAIFETEDIADRDVMSLVFGQTSLDADARSQVEAAIHACIGEDAINFAFNEHLLVNEVAKTMPDGRVKTLDLSWSAITDECDTVVRLMLCVRDVTELRRLAAESTQQKRQLEMIGEILAVSQDKFHQFVESAKGFIHENERIIGQHEHADESALAELFRNMHTIKGNARTYGLRHLTSIVHEAEQRYDAMRRLGADEAWDREASIAELARVKQAVEHYATINEVSLGRKGPGALSHRAQSGRYMVVDRSHIDESVRLVESVGDSDTAGLVAMRDAVRRTLRLLDTESFEQALAGLIESLPSLAEELGKRAPKVAIDDNGYRLRRHASGALRDVFTHLLRNSVDHGIEPADERVAAGKPEAGAIEIDVGVDAGALQITLSDDGRGLAMRRIRAIAAERGWIEPHATLSDDAVARFIFRAGFSTAGAVTEVSGRGVGMDAVKAMLERELGRIELRFTDERDGADFRRFQTIVHLPEAWVVDSLGAPLEQGAKAARDDALA
ncbi:HAMP domain-containing protein [Trinickia sp. Y13]|uniref:HAMP domain-containing protein n=1 Tax=Trinickia sp. Y13 TaxID=2917807 RepID=UPI0024072F5A|nr:HAMP domain-containing protein [Trinickia sp. Y13]MDG0022752.1 HAMP domain-containing protein [Trinickia sp. Y13]